MNLDQPALHASTLEGAVRSGGLDCQGIAPKCRAARTHLAKRLEGILVGQTKVRMVENVEEAPTQFELHAFCDREDLVDVEVRVKVTKTTEAVTGNVARSRAELYHRSR